MDRILTLAVVGLYLWLIVFLTIFRLADRWVDFGGSMTGLGRATTIFICALLGAIVIDAVALGTASVWLPDHRLRLAQWSIAAITGIALLYWVTTKANDAAPVYPNAKPVLDFEVRTAHSYLQGTRGVSFYYGGGQSLDQGPEVRREEDGYVIQARSYRPLELKEWSVVVNGHDNESYWFPIRLPSRPDTDTSWSPWTRAERKKGYAMTEDIQVRARFRIQPDGK